MIHPFRSGYFAIAAGIVGTIAGAALTLWAAPEPERASEVVDNPAHQQKIESLKATVAQQEARFAEEVTRCTEALDVEVKKSSALTQQLETAENTLRKERKDQQVLASNMETLAHAFSELSEEHDNAAKEIDMFVARIEQLQVPIEETTEERRRKELQKREDEKRRLVAHYAAQRARHRRAARAAKENARRAASFSHHWTRHELAKRRGFH
jgi:chromosome segregation ATPase